MYIYPDNLKSKAVLWLWELRDIAIVGVGALISVDISKAVHSVSLRQGRNTVLRESGAA